MNKKWYVGAMNDALFVIDRKPSPSGTDAPPSTNSGAKVICKVEGSGHPEDASNAYLLAAAPRLRYALKCLLGELPSRRDWLDPVTEAIAKDALEEAEGVRA